MSEVGIRALEQTPLPSWAPAACGETITITDRGRAVAQYPWDLTAGLTMNERLAEAASHLPSCEPRRSGAGAVLVVGNGLRLAIKR